MTFLRSSEGVPTAFNMASICSIPRTSTCSISPSEGVRTCGLADFSLPNRDLGSESQSKLTSNGESGRVVKSDRL